MAIADFVTKLGADASLFRQFDDEPDAAMEGTDLSEDEKRILKGRDARQISEAISADGPFVAGVIGVPVTEIVVDNE